MSALLIALVFVGFARTLFLRSSFGTLDPALGTPQMPWHLYLHGGLLTTWFVLLLVQTTLVASHRTDLHRGLGVLGGVVAVLVVVVGVWTVIASIPRNVLAGIDETGRRINLFGNLATLIVFILCIGRALVLRRQPDSHRRLMLLGSIAIVGQATQRIGFMIGFAPLGPLSLPVLLFTLIAHDLWSRRRIHPATLWGIAVLMVSLVLTPVVARSPIGSAVMERLYATGR